MKYSLEFKWTISRGRDTYGYNICSLYVNGKKVSSCNGGGYDMSGVCISDWMEKEFQDGLKALDAEKYYGLRKYDDGDDVMYVDGACGFSSMERILEALGWQLEKMRVSGDVYLLTKKEQQ